MKTISRCAACGSNNLVQDYLPRHHSDRIGGEVTTSPPSLNGCHCGDCGTRNVFNKAGECPACHGTGEFESITGSCGIEHYRSKYRCSVCDGKGQI